MKKPDLIKQLANRINQPHVIESWIDKIEKAAYNKGLKDAESKQCNIPVVSGSLQSLQEWAKSEKDGQVEQIIVMTAFGNTIVVDLSSKSSIKEFCEWQ